MFVSKKAVCQNAGSKSFLSQSAATSLDNFAAVALRRCLTLSPPLDTARTYEALQRLCPEDGWQLLAEQATTQGMQPPSQMVGPLPIQQAAIAAVLLDGFLERHGGDVAAAGCILRFALACTATLARVMKSSQADQKVCKGKLTNSFSTAFLLLSCSCCCHPLCHNNRG